MGQAWSLVEQLRGLDGSARERQLRSRAPSLWLGPELILRINWPPDRSGERRAAQGLLVLRDKYTQFISRIDDGSQLLSIKLPAERV